MSTLKLVTINFWGTEAPLEKRLALAERQLAALDADVIAVQEVRPLADKDGATTAEHMADALGFSHRFEPVLSWQAGAFGDGSKAGLEGLAILSRHPIGDHRITPLPEPRPLERRALLSAEILHPAGATWCHTTHLHYRLDDGAAREKQVVAIDEVIRNIETPRPQLLCGDFNATPEHDEIRFLRGLTTLAGRRTHYQDAFLRIHPHADGFTWSSENEQTRPLRSLDIDRRIDYVFVTSRRRDGLGTVIDAGVCLAEREDGICCSDHFGVFAEVALTPREAS